VHKFEQHWLGVVQGLPAMRQVPPVIDWQKPPVQRPLQQSVLFTHAAAGVSGRHACAAHCRFEPQYPEQQSEPMRHAAPRLKHAWLPVPQTLGVLAPQMPPFAHAPAPTPHWCSPPHPSGMKPQFMPLHATACAMGVHWLPPPQTLACPPPPHRAGDVQVPHGMTPPQPSAIGPHEFGGHVVSGTHAPPPSAVTTPPPQTFD
jgi:hypothetical protein